MMSGQDLWKNERVFGLRAGPVADTWLVVGLVATLAWFAYLP
jgi:hypothetical protein